MCLRIRATHLPCQASNQSSTDAQATMKQELARVLRRLGSDFAQDEGKSQSQANCSYFKCVIDIDSDEAEEADDDGDDGDDGVCVGGEAILMLMLVIMTVRLCGSGTLPHSKNPSSTRFRVTETVLLVPVMCWRLRGKFHSFTSRV